MGKEKLAMCLGIYKLSEKIQHKVPKWELRDEGVWGKRKKKKKTTQNFFFPPKLNYFPATSAKI